MWGKIPNLYMLLCVVFINIYKCRIYSTWNFWYYLSRWTSTYKNEKKKLFPILPCHFLCTHDHCHMLKHTVTSITAPCCDVPVTFVCECMWVHARRLSVIDFCECLLPRHLLCPKRCDIQQLYCAQRDTYVVEIPFFFLVSITSTIK